MKFSALARLQESSRRRKKRQAQNRARTKRLSLECLEVRQLLVGGPIILGGDDLNDHGSVSLNEVAGTGNTVAESEVNNTSGAADPAVLGDDYTGEITVGDDVDFLSFAATAGQNIAIQVQPNTITGALITLYDTDGVTVLDTEIAFSTLNFSVPATGIYFVGVEGEGVDELPGSGNAILETEANDTSGTADPTAIGDNYGAEINPSGDADYVSFTLAAGERIRLSTLLGTIVDAQITIYDTDGTTELNNTSDTSLDFQAPVAGTYFAAVRGDGEFALPGTGTTVAESEANDSSAAADTAAVGDDYDGSIGASGDADYVALTLAAGEQVRLSTVLTTLADARVTVYDTDGTTELDSATFDFNFQAPAAGTYFVAVQGEGFTPLPGNGNTVAETEANNTSATADAVVVGDDYAGDINPSGEVDYVAITLVAGQQIRLETVLGTLGDSTLTLYDTDGTSQLAFNDDGGVGLASLIDFTAPAAGTYFVAARRFGGSGTGTYTLQVRDVAEATGDYTLNIRSVGPASGDYTLELRSLADPTGTYTVTLREAEAVLNDGWLYIRRALENIAPAVTRAGNDGSVALLGSTDSNETGGDTGAAYHFATPQAAETTALTGLVRYYDGATAINQFFTDLAAGTVNPSIIVTAGAGASNSLDFEEGPALTNNAIAIANFVNSGGGLLSHGDESNVSYGWLFALLPGLTAVEVSDEDNLEMTPAGISAFPGVTDDDINAGPWHNYFEPYSALGDLNILAHHVDGVDVDGNQRAVIIGGVVTLPGSIVLAPAADEHELGETHTVTATVTDGQPPAPSVGTVVTFDVVTGPNAGTTGTCTVNVDCTTDANGEVSFSYVGDGGAGTDIIQATFVDLQGNTQFSNDANVVWLPPPQVVGIFARGTAWQQSFLDELAAEGAGNAALGASLPLPNSQEGAVGQPNNLPWTNVNQISIVFGEDMTLDIDSLTLVGSSTLAQPPAASGFDYDDTTFTATWTFPSVLARNKYLVHLNASAVTDSDGQALDGEWVVPDVALPTGDDVPGGDFNFRFNVLPADVNGTGTVATAESDGIRRKLNLSPTSDQYSHRQDLDGSGVISPQDFNSALLVLNTTTNFLANPAVPSPPAGLFSATQSSLATGVNDPDVAAPTLRSAVDPVAADRVYTELAMGPMTAEQHALSTDIWTAVLGDRGRDLRGQTLRIRVSFR